MSLRDGLLAEYLFRGDADDSSGHGRHGVVHGAALTADRFGRPDSAYRFDGIDNEIVVSPPPIARDALTVSVWACFDPRDLGRGNGPIASLPRTTATMTTSPAASSR